MATNNVVSLEYINKAYEKEKGVDTKERILLIRRVMFDGVEASTVAERELHKGRWWAYKWLKRFRENGLEGLKDLPRSGRPPKISEKKMYKIKQKVIESKTGWEVKEVMNLIYEKAGVMYHEVHVRRLLHGWSMSPKVPKKRHVNSASPAEKEDFKKEYWIYAHIPQKDLPP